jgi:hypothetical protein
MIHAQLRYYYKQTDEYLDLLSDAAFFNWYADLIVIRQSEIQAST